MATFDPIFQLPHSALLCQLLKIATMYVQLVHSTVQVQVHTSSFINGIQDNSRCTHKSQNKQTNNAIDTLKTLEVCNHTARGYCVSQSPETNVLTLERHWSMNINEVAITCVHNIILTD